MRAQEENDSVVRETGRTAIIVSAITGCFKGSWFRFHYLISETRVFVPRYQSSGVGRVAQSV